MPFSVSCRLVLCTNKVLSVCILYDNSLSAMSGFDVMLGAVYSRADLRWSVGVSNC